jgi:hypothetical protein
MPLGDGSAAAPFGRGENSRELIRHRGEATGKLTIAPARLE